MEVRASNSSQPDQSWYYSDRELSRHPHPLGLGLLVKTQSSQNKRVSAVRIEYEDGSWSRFDVQAE